MSAKLLPFLSGLTSLERAQWLPKETLEEIQWKRFKKILKYAYEKTPFYKEKFDRAGIRIEDIRHRNDLDKIPLTTREDIRNPERLIAAGHVQNKLKFSTSSGSSGIRTTAYFNKKAWLLGKFLLKLRARVACGLRPWDRIAVFNELTTPGGLLKEYLLRQKTFSVVRNLETYSSELEDYSPSALYGFPSYLSILADKNVNISPKHIFTSSEVLTGETRLKIANAFGAELFDVYGCTEMKEISWECPEHQGYHINSDWLLVEFAKPGQKSLDANSRIIVTSLYNYGMPLIRYEVGDTAKLLEKKCPCGRGLPLMGPLLGRIVDYFVLPDNRIVSPYAMTCAIENLEGMRQYQIKQKRKNYVTVNVVPSESFNSHIGNQVIAALETVLPGATVEIRIVDAIEADQSGKCRVVISELSR